MTRWLLPIGLLFGVALGAGCGDRPSTDDCDKLLVHMIKLDAEAAGSGDVTPEVAADLAQQQKDLASESRKSFIKQCNENTATKYVSCALSKKTKAALVECNKI